MSTYFKEGTDNESQSAGTFQKISIYIQTINDKILYYRNERWGAAGFFFFIYMLRVLILGRYHALTYCIGIHVLNSFIGFISPIDDPEDDEDEQISYLPQK